MEFIFTLKTLTYNSRNFRENGSKFFENIERDQPILWNNFLYNNKINVSHRIDSLPGDSV